MTLLKDLQQIGLERGTDKASLHRYCEFYHDLLSPIRHDPISMAEIGVDGGESLRMWSEFFTHPEAKIYGVDIHDKGVDPGRAKFILGDGTNPNFIYDLGTNHGPFDVVLDDGSHYSGQQKDSLRLLWPHVKSGGLYICEDCHTSYSYPWTTPEEISFVHSTMDWIDSLMEKGADHCGVPTESDVLEIIFRKSLVIIKKR